MESEVVTSPVGMGHPISSDVDDSTLSILCQQWADIRQCIRYERRFAERSLSVGFLCSD